MTAVSYETRRDEIETYFDRTAADAWAALTSDAPVSRIRRTVRRGRDAMRETLLSWLPEDLTGSTGPVQDDRIHGVQRERAIDLHSRHREGKRQTIRNVR